MDQPDIVARVLGVVAILIALASAWYTRKQATATTEATRIEQDRRRDEIAAREREEEAARVASMDVRLSPPERNGAFLIMVRNDGPHTALDVSLVFDAADDGLPALDTQSWKEIRGPMRPGDGHRVGAGVSADTTKRFRVLLTWTDGRGQQRETFSLAAR